jgi:large subunit ribosomal protein L10
VAITRERKEELVAKYNSLLSESDGIVIIQYTGMTVKDVQALRAKIRQADGEYLVTKNTLFGIALQQQGWPVPEAQLDGPVAVAFSRSNFPALTKVVFDNIKELSEKLTVKGGVMSGNVLNARDVNAVSNLPSLSELRSQIVGLIVQPAAGLVSVLNAATGQVVNVIAAYVKEQGGEAA